MIAYIAADAAINHGLHDPVGEILCTEFAPECREGRGKYKKWNGKR